MGAYDDYLARIAMAESGGRADAQNPNSSAAGPYQFIDSTWLEHASPLRPDLDRASLLALKKDPTFSKQVAERFTAVNDERLRSAGIEPTDQYRSLAHFAGPQGAINLIKGDPNASAGSILGQSVVDANPFLRNMTAAQAVQWAQDRLNGKGGGQRGAIPGIPNQQPEDTSYVNSLLKGGPLALFGMGRQGYDWGNALMGAAASLASINSPAQGAAIASLMKKPSDDWDISVDQNGLIRRVNKRTGQVTSQVDPNFIEQFKLRKQAEANYSPPKGKDIDTFNAYKDYLDKNYDIADTAKELQDMLASNPGFGGWMDKAKAYLGAGLTDFTKNIPPETVKALQDANLLSSPEQQAFFGKLQKFRQDLVWAGLAKEKGVQTEGDAIRMGQKFFSSLSSMSGEQLMRDLDDIRGGALKDHTRAFSNYKGYVDRYGPYNVQFQGDNALIDRYTSQHTVTSDALRRYDEAKKARQEAIRANPQATQPRDPNRLNEIFR